MPFFAPNHVIFEAIKYDGTPQSAIKVIKWVEPQITTSDQIKFNDGRLLVSYHSKSTDLEKTREVGKGDFVCVLIGHVKVFSSEDIKQNYERLPFMDFL